MNIAIAGYGRMGKKIEMVCREKGLTVVSTIDMMAQEAKYSEINAESLSGVDVVIDFTYPDAALENISKYVHHGVDVIMGTTGWFDKMEEVTAMVGDTIGFLWSGNFSTGVNIYFRIVRAASKLFDRFPDYDPMLYEIHHNQKKDSPSGTAEMIGAILLEEIGRKNRGVTEKLDRQIAEDEIHFASMRGGHYHGTHSVQFDSPVDTIEIKHTARNREGFARGAVDAAQWLHGKKGLFSIDDYIDSIMG
jgi:4-hydroxy-tetrahydrodipicolinate reductase